MPNRTAKFVSAIFACILAGALPAAASDNAAPAADNCLAAPNAVTPLGSHWYYRIDWPTKRHCWYIRDEKEKLSRAAPQDSPASAAPVSPQRNAVAPKSMADARDEMPPPRTVIEQDTAVTPTQRIPPPAANAASVDQAADAPDAHMRGSIVASRWPEPAEVRSSDGTMPADPTPASGSPVANLQSNPPAAAANASVTFAAADSSSARQSSAIPKLLAVIVGAFSVLAVMGSAVFRLGSTRQIAIDRRSPPIYPNSGPRRASNGLHRDARTADDASRRIAQMMTRLSQNRPR